MMTVDEFTLIAREVEAERAQARPADVCVIDCGWREFAFRLYDEVVRLWRAPDGTILDRRFYRPDRLTNVEKRLAAVEAILAEIVKPEPDEPEPVEAQHRRFASKVRGGAITKLGQ